MPPPKPAKPMRPNALPPREQPAPPRTPNRSLIDAASPWLPVPYERPDVVAAQALMKGVADKEQQLRIVEWIKRASGLYEMTFFPGPDGARNSDFAQGRRFVGLQFAKLTLLNPGLVKATVPQADKYEPKA